jgi:hypothetical protein
VATEILIFGRALSGAVRPCSLPADALLAKYVGAGAYTDCYALDVAEAVSHAEFVEAFYTGRAFKIERFLLGLFLSRPSTDIEVKQLAIGEIDHFSGWRVEDRSTNQLLMRDIMSGKTRSWLMVEPQAEGSTPVTRLYFGSAVLADMTQATGEPRMGRKFASLLWFHKIYSRILLDGARARLAQISH